MLEIFKLKKRNMFIKKMKNLLGLKKSVKPQTFCGWEIVITPNKYITRVFETYKDENKNTHLRKKEREFQELASVEDTIELLRILKNSNKTTYEDNKILYRQGDEKLYIPKEIKRLALKRGQLDLSFSGGTIFTDGYTVLTGILDYEEEDVNKPYYGLKLRRLY